ncbi:DNA repair protein RadC [Chryseomicrobium palamuruense]|uniref:DNA repair protein RadC n=1 Tax=Chryseomicrobium palamuruense TaxID=682973 RepID=A0ABV8UXG2_9BACL
MTNIHADAFELIRDVNRDDRPRERLIQQGPQSLSNQELIAILLRTGTKETSVLSLSNEILKYFERIHHLKNATIEELTQIKGVGTVKAVQLLAAVEFGRRLAVQDAQDRVTVRSPKDAADYIKHDLHHLMQEHFVLLFLNVKNQIIHKQTIFIGGLSASIVHPREVFREAIKKSCASIIAVHNHPSGNPTPSPEDIAVTKRLKDAGEIMGIELLDHLIIGDHQFISLKEKGYM